MKDHPYIQAVVDLGAAFRRRVEALRPSRRSWSPITRGSLGEAIEQGHIAWETLPDKKALQERVAAQLPAYIGLPVAERESSAALLRKHDSIVTGVAGVLLRRACARRDPGAFAESLHLLATADAGLDYRDTLRSLCIWWHAALRIGIDARALFDSVSASATSGAAELLEGFAYRLPEDQTLAAFGIDEVELERLFLS